MIDRGIAERVAGAVGGGPGEAGPLPGDLADLCAHAEERVVAYTGLRPLAPLPPPEAVSRADWRAANLDAMDAVLGPLTERLSAGAGPLGGAMRAAGGALVGAEVGALAGYLSRRVLGQYDVRLLEEGAPARLLFVAPNLHEAAAELRADPEQLLGWVAVHEVTHAVQFGAVGWLREHIAGMLRELLGSLDVKLDPAGLLRLPSITDLRAFGDAVREGSLVTLVAGPRRAEALDRIQAVMALIEGHAEHVMDTAAPDLLGDLTALRAALDRRRRDRPEPLRWLERLIGLELKMRQYEQGKAFCDAVVAREDVAALHRAFAAPDLLPTLAELDDPAAWLRRTAPGALPGAATA